ncbi:MAG: hypothetical protein JW839_22645 [Candidatus Lokiarchaeota archaeon]|nr:hypothetical protein [Candidatus Lokiarchaeota archaeon]
MESGSFSTRGPRTALLVSSVLLACSFLAGSAAARLGDNGSSGNIAWQQQWHEFIDFGESTSGSVQPRQFYVHTNASTAVYVLNATGFADYITSSSLPAIPDIVVNGEFEEQWTVSFLNITYGLPIVDEPVNNYRHVELYLVLANENPVNTTVQFLVRIGYAPHGMFLADLSVFIKFLAVASFAIVSIMLLWKSRSIRLHEEKSKRADTLRGFGLGYFFGFLAFFLGEFRVYWESETGGFSQRLFEIRYDVVNFPIDYFDLFICTLLMLGSLTFLAMTYIVEKKVKSRRVPVVSINQLIATGLIPLVFAIPPLFIFSIVYLTVAVAIAAAQIVFVYVQLAAKSAGWLRWRSILILLGIMLPVSCFVIRLFVQNPLGSIFYIVVDSIDMLGIYLFYLGNIKYADRQT